MLVGAYIVTATDYLIGIQEQYTRIEFLCVLAQKIVVLQSRQQTRH